MDQRDWLAEQFETQRSHLRAVAFRMLGSTIEADDAVQEAWLRLSRTDTSDVDNLGGWLTTVVGRVCLDMLRSRKSRREDPLDVPLIESKTSTEKGSDPEHEAVMADSVGLAMLVVLETLTPAERLAFVLHDMFAVSFEEIAPIVGRTPAAARQLASRARRRVQGTEPEEQKSQRNQREIVDAFLAASREGNFGKLLAILDPDIVLRSDAAAAQMGSNPVLVGAQAIIDRFSGGARALFPANIDGQAGAAWVHQGQPKVVFIFTVNDGRISAIKLVADTERLAEMDIEYFTKRS